MSGDNDADAPVGVAFGELFMQLCLVSLARAKDRQGILRLVVELRRAFPGLSSIGLTDRRLLGIIASHTSQTSTGGKCSHNFTRRRPKLQVRFHLVRSAASPPQRIPLAHPLNLYGHC